MTQARTQKTQMQKQIGGIAKSQEMVQQRLIETREDVQRIRLEKEQQLKKIDA